jgi:hypothetical protein
MARPLLSARCTTRRLDRTLRRATSIADNSERAGAAHIFSRQADGRYIHSTYLKPPVLANFLHFGQALSLSPDGQWLAIGADFGGYADGLALAANYNVPIPATVGGAVNGRVYLFNKTAQGWQQVALFAPTNVGILDRRFGYDVALSADARQLAASMASDNTARAPAPATGSLAKSGSVYVYRKEGESWQAPIKRYATPAVEFSYFGNSVSLSSDGKMLIVGASSEDSAGRGINPVNDGVRTLQSGAAYIFK